MAKKTTLRTVRLDSQVDELLKQDAQRRRVSVNSLISEIFAKYAEWDRYTEKFGMISVTRQGFRILMEHLEDEVILEQASEMGGVNVPEVILFWFKKLNLETFLKFISLCSKYGNNYEYEVESSGRDCCITLHHDLGEKYSTFLRHYFDHAIRKIIGVAPKLEVGRNSLVVRFSQPVP